MNVKHTSGATNDHTFLEDHELHPHDIAIFDKADVDCHSMPIGISKIFTLKHEKKITQKKH